MTGSPLHLLEHALHRWVAFIVVPLFGFANAGISFAGLTTETLLEPVTLGIAAGLVLGKLVGVAGSATLTIRLGLAELPMGATWPQLFGMALLCGIGFTMSLFIGMLAFAEDPTLLYDVKIGILGGSLLAGLAGWGLLRMAPQAVRARA
jgi:NhaA family Na+:H+ antiporter